MARDLFPEDNDTFNLAEKKNCKETKRANVKETRLPSHSPNARSSLAALPYPERTSLEGVCAPLQFVYFLS